MCFYAGFLIMTNEARKMDNKNVGGGLFILGQSREELAEYHITGSGRFLTGNPDGLIIVGWLCIILFGAFL